MEFFRDDKGVCGFLVRQLHSLNSVGHDVSEVIGILLHEGFTTKEQLHIHGVVVNRDILQVLVAKLYLPILHLEFETGLR